jgi:hypothetical protein
LQLKRSKYGAFLGCSRYSEGCTYTEKVVSKKRAAGRKRQRKKT